MTGRYFFSVILLICVATAAAQDDDHCPYTLVTKTGIPSDIGDAMVALILGNNSSINFTIRNLSEYSILCPPCFQSDKLDVFRFHGPCDHENNCNGTLKLQGREDDYWNIEFFQLEALFPNNDCYSRMYHANKTLNYLDDEYKFYFCDDDTEAVGTEKQKLTGASLLRLVGMPSYTT